MKKSLKKGFTLIELLVVVAIIGILATVVLASLGSARNKAKDSAIQAGYSAIRAQAELIYTNTYVGTCADPKVAAIIAGALGQGATAQDCNESATAWAAEAVLTDGTTYYCTDSTGFAGTNGALSIEDGETACSLAN